MKLKSKKINIVAILTVLVIAIIGSKLLFSSHAATTTASLAPASDIATVAVVGVGSSTTSLYKDVSDGTSFTAANDNVSYVRSEAGVPTASHTVGYTAFAPTSNLNQVVVNFRAYNGSGTASSSAQVLLYNGSQLIGTGSVHSLGDSYANYTDTFSGLTINGAQLSTKMILRNSGANGAPRYTQIWVDTTFGVPTVTTPPTTPTGVTATATSSSNVDLKWTTSTDGVGPGVAGYYIIRNGTTLATVTATSYSDTSVAPSTAYSYTLESFDSSIPANVSSPSTAVPVTTPAAISGTGSGIIRAAFYYPWFPNAWNQQGFNPFTNYTPSLGYYSSNDATVIKNHIASMQYGNLNAGIISWWGQGSQEDTVVPADLAGANGTGFKWSLYYENEGTNLTSTAQIQSDLSYIKNKYASNPNYLTKNGKPVIFVYGQGSDTCANYAAPWSQANATEGFYVVLKVFTGYQTCANDADSWHQYAPANAEQHQSGYSFAVAPGFYKKGEAAPRLVRNVSTWTQNLKDMVASNEPLQLITTFNEWGEGSSIESAQQWSSPSGYGSYLDAMHNNIPGSSVTPPPSDLIAPSVPTNLTTSLATATGNTININWGASTDNTGGSGLKQYNITRTDGLSVVKYTVPAGTTTYTDSATVSATKYSYQISAQDNAGNISALTSSVATTTPGTSGADPIITAAGDIACDPTNSSFLGTATECQQRATAKVVTGINPTAVITMGDNQYESGTLTNFNSSFDPSWGTFKVKIHPSIGNHEGGQGGSNSGYFDYYNGVGVQAGAAGNRSQGYYSYNIGKWHLIALNSNCGTYLFNGSSTGCQAGSPQDTWLKADLAANPKVCTLAYWHVPRFSSGSSHHNDAAHDNVYTTLWNDLYAGGADVILNGHDHDYERFQPLDPSGVVDTAHGITEIISGLGGESQYSFGSVVNGSAYRAVGFGVLKLTLHSGSYDWQFVDAPGSTISDSGTANCHLGGITTPPPVDITPPTTPSNLKATVNSATSVTLNWGASTDSIGVANYRIYRNGNTINSVTNPTLNYTDSSALPNTVYNYQISAVDLAGNESVLSSNVSVTTPALTTPDTIRPSVPGNLTGIFVPNTQINLSWTASTDNVGVARYSVSRNGTVLNSSVTTTTFGDNTVSINNSYVYTVTAYDAAGNASITAASVNVSTAVTSPPPSGNICGSTSTVPAKYKHVIWIWMENHSYTAVINTPSAPYQTSLANQCATNTQMQDAGSQYNSLSNYIAGTSGLDSCSGGSSCNGNSTWNDCSYSATSCHSPNDNIFRQVRASGGTAKSFEEDMPSNCYPSNSGSNGYAIRHNPAAYFDGGSDKSACMADDVPLGTTSSGNFLNALSSDSTLPTFSFVTPNLCNDVHSCTVSVGDNWLKGWLPKIFNSPAYTSGDTAVFIEYDEDSPVPNVVIAPSVKHVVLNDGSYSHYSELRSTEEMLGLPTLGKASSAPSLRAPYNL
jgi:chitodextrinase